VLEFGREKALEIVFHDEDVEEIGIAPAAKDIPGECGDAERCDSDRMKTAEGVTPALGEGCPKQHATASEDQSGRTFGQRG